MRSGLLALLVASSLAAATGGCQQSALETFIANTACTCATKLATCLGADVDARQLDWIRECFVQNGCTDRESLRGRAAWVAGDCVQGGSDGELRKRADRTTSSNAKTTSTGNPTTSVQAKTTSAASTTSQTSTSATASTQNEAASTTSDSASTDATTTTDSTSSDSTSSSTMSTASSTTSTAATANSQTTSSTTTLQCSVTNMVTATVCSYSSADGKTSKIGCGASVSASPSCAPGVICQTDTAGNPICMLRDDKLTTSGTAVAIVFGIAIGGIAIAIFVMNMKSRAATRRAKLERVALLGGGGNGIHVPYQHNPSEANVPLMSPSGTRREAADPADGQQGDYQQTVDDGSAPRLHPGLGALGQDTTYSSNYRS